jgi:hypothetical protein
MSPQSERHVTSEHERDDGNARAIGDRVLRVRTAMPSIVLLNVWPYAIMTIDK